jgi:urease accessory protein
MHILRLLQLSDSALPIGSTAHSFGVETLVAEQLLSPQRLEAFLTDFFTEAGLVEAVFCRAGYRLASESSCEQFEQAWVVLNQRLSALKPARETREASAVLGRRFLRLVASLEASPRLQEALSVAQSHQLDIHHSTAFGLAAGVLALDENEAVLALLQQSAACLISACQRLMPVGQSFASHLLWHLHPTQADVANRSLAGTPTTVGSFSALVELGSMRHPQLPVRLFIS